MNENQKYGIIAVGILLGGLFPSGLQVFLFKFLESLLLRIDSNVYVLSAIAAYSAAVISVLIFIKTFDYFVTFDFLNRKSIIKALSLGLLLYIILQILLMVLPFLQGLFGTESNIELWKKYEEPYSNIYFEILVPTSSSLLCFIAMAIIVLKKVTQLPTTGMTNSSNHSPQ